jgi:chromosome segregation ATPase
MSIFFVDFLIFNNKTKEHIMKSNEFIEKQTTDLNAQVSDHKQRIKTFATEVDENTKKIGEIDGTIKTLGESKNPVVVEQVNQLKEAKAALERRNTDLKNATETSTKDISVNEAAIKELGGTAAKK